MKTTVRNIVHRILKHSLALLLCINCVDNKSIGIQNKDNNKAESFQIKNDDIKTLDQNIQIINKVGQEVKTLEDANRNLELQNSSIANLNPTELSNIASHSSDSPYETFRKNLEESKITKEDVIKEWQSAVDKILNPDNIRENNNTLIDAKKTIELILNNRPDDIDKTMLEETFLKAIATDENGKLKSTELAKLIISKIDDTKINTLFNDAIKMDEEDKIKSADLAEFLIEYRPNDIDSYTINSAFVRATIPNFKWNVRYWELAKLILRNRPDGINAVLIRTAFDNLEEVISKRNGCEKLESIELAWLILLQRSEAVDKNVIRHLWHSVVDSDKIEDDKYIELIKLIIKMYQCPIDSGDINNFLSKIISQNKIEANKYLELVEEALKAYPCPIDSDDINKVLSKIISLGKIETLGSWKLLSLILKIKFDIVNNDIVFIKGFYNILIKILKDAHYSNDYYLDTLNAILSNWRSHIIFVEELLNIKDDIAINSIIQLIWNCVRNATVEPGKWYSFLKKILISRPDLIDKEMINNTWELNVNPNSIPVAVIIVRLLLEKKPKDIDADMIRSIWNCSKLQDTLGCESLAEVIIKKRSEDIDRDSMRKFLNNIVKSYKLILENDLGFFLRRRSDDIDEDLVQNAWSKIIEMDDYGRLKCVTYRLSASENGPARYSESQLDRLICAEYDIRSIAIFSKNGSYVITNAQLEVYANDQTEAGDTQLRSFTRRELNRRDPQRYRYNENGANSWEVRESIMKVDYVGGYKALEDIFELKINDIKSKFPDPRKRIQEIIIDSYERVAAKLSENEEAVVVQFDRKDKITPQHIYLLLLALENRSKEDIQLFIGAFTNTITANNGKVDRTSCMPQAFIIDALSILDGLRFLQFYTDEARENAMYDHNNEATKTLIEENKVTKQIFCSKETVANLAKEPNTFKENLKKMAHQRGLIEISADQKIRLEIIEKYYLDLEKNSEPIRKQKEREQKFINFANESRELSIDELFSKIRDFMALEYSDMYAEEPDYLGRFKEIFAYVKNREMNNNESAKLGRLLSKYLQQKYGE